MTFYQLLTFISIFIVLVPLSISLFTIRRIALTKVMFALLATGLIIEIFMINTDPDFVLRDRVFDAYCILESTLFFWIVRSRIAGLTGLGFLKSVVLFSFPLFIVSVYILPLVLKFSFSGMAIFNMAYEIVISFYAGVELLRLIEEKRDPLAAPFFWVVLGIFFYCFSTFFIMSLLYSGISFSIWYVNNIINIITYLMYSYGLWKGRSFKQTPSSTHV